MQIIVDIREGENGRPVGTVRSSATAHALPFSGNLEFMALIERLYRIDYRSDSQAQPDAGHETGGAQK
ncbi:MAG TPA: hypothetical protein VHZ96_20665 [Frankiaceae bacterium]|jgi:hypothetical protein|nr:hypothetical protein [Frankiaceae bacterium]